MEIGDLVWYCPSTGKPSKAVIVWAAIHGDWITIYYFDSHERMLVKKNNLKLLDKIK
jgi:hypothetical protein